MVRRALLAMCCWLATASAALCVEVERPKQLLQWERLPDLPQAISGQFVGVGEGALIVAGGAHFPAPLFEGGEKVWVDTIFVLEPGADAWASGSSLDRPLAYGASVTADDGIICIGGCDAERCYAQVFRLRRVNAEIQRTPLPDLPRPCAMTSGAMIGDSVYVAGGQDSPAATGALSNFWRLDLNKAELGWEELDPWPGPARILPVAAAQDGAFYLISGAELLAGPDGKVKRRYLTDAYGFRPKTGWEKVAGVPRAIVAAPAVGYGESHILVFGGDDGENADRVWELKDEHPGFSRDILAYHTITDTWSRMGTVPAGLVTTAAVQWQDGIVIPGGEDRPGHRSASVHKGRAPEAKAHFGSLDYAALGVYLAALVMMGVYFARREKSTADFFLAGRRIPWWAAGLSIFGTQLSAITFMAIPAKAYATDWVYILGNMCIFLIAPLVIFCYLPFFRRLNVTTAYEYLEKRFNLAVRAFSSAAFILYQLSRMGIVICLPAIALSTVTGFDVYVCILLMGILATVYTVLGGIEAVIWTDVLQVVVLMGGALLSVLIIAANVDGGFAAIISTGMAEAKFHTFNWTWDITMMAVWVVVVGNLFSNLLPYTADQTVIQRYLTTKDEKQAAKAIWTNGILAIPTALIFFGLGTALFVFYKGHAGLLNPAVKTDAIFPLFIAQQLPAGVSGLVIAGLFAASMSSLDSSMNSIATAMVSDFYRRFWPQASDHYCLNLARWLTAILGVVGTSAGLMIARMEIVSLWDLFIKVLGLIFSPVAGILALGIFTRRAHGVGALIGGVTSAVLLYLVQQYTSIHFFLWGAVGVVSCFVVGYLASLLIPAPERPLEGLTVYAMSERTDFNVGDAP